jgi:hypothetical protein
MNENYIGNYVYNRTTQRLGQKPRSNAPSLWIRAVGVLDPIVEPTLFLEAQYVKRRRRFSLSNREMLARLSTLLKEKGRLSRPILDAANYLPHSTSFLNRFGSLSKAYRLVGHHRKNSFDYAAGATSALVTNTITELTGDLIARVEANGGFATFDTTTDELTIDRHLIISFYVARCKRTKRGWLRWIVRRRSTLRGDLIVALRMDEHGNLMDYLLLPVANFPVCKMEFAEPNRKRLDGCRFDQVDELFKSIWRSRNDPTLFPKIKQGRPPLGYAATVS